MAEHTIHCHECQTPFTFDGTLSFRAECDKCSADLHACLTCRFYDRYSENECREVIADPIQVKDRRNLCELYKPKPPGDAGAEDDKVADAKAKLEALFSKK